MKFCNCCGKPIVAPFQSSISIKHRFGYGSKYDGDYLDADICEQCLESLLDGVRDSWQFDPVRSMDEFMSQNENLKS